MKSLFFCLLFCFSCLVSFAGPGDTLRVAIGINTDDNNVIKDTRSALSSVKNVKVICFCTNSQVFILRANTNDYSSGEELFKSCEKAAGDTKLYLKEGNIKSIFSECYYSTDEDPAAIKSFIDQ